VSGPLRQYQSRLRPAQGPPSGKPVYANLMSPTRMTIDSLEPTVDRRLTAPGQDRRFQVGRRLPIREGRHLISKALPPAFLAALSQPPRDCLPPPTRLVSLWQNYSPRWAGTRCPVAQRRYHAAKAVHHRNHQAKYYRQSATRGRRLRAPARPLLARSVPRRGYTLQ
jgi:hypothetical protein